MHARDEVRQLFELGKRRGGQKGGAEAGAGRGDRVRAPPGGVGGSAARARARAGRARDYRTFCTTAASICWAPWAPPWFGFTVAVRRFWSRSSFLFFLIWIVVSSRRRRLSSWSTPFLYVCFRCEGAKRALATAGAARAGGERGARGFRGSRQCSPAQPRCSPWPTCFWPYLSGDAPRRRPTLAQPQAVQNVITRGERRQTRRGCRPMRRDGARGSVVSAIVYNTPLPFLRTRSARLRREKREREVAARDVAKRRAAAPATVAAPRKQHQKKETSEATLGPRRARRR